MAKRTVTKTRLSTKTALLISVALIGAGGLAFSVMNYTLRIPKALPYDLNLNSSLDCYDYYMFIKQYGKGKYTSGQLNAMTSAFQSTGKVQACNAIDLNKDNIINCSDYSNITPSLPPSSIVSALNIIRDQGLSCAKELKSYISVENGMATLATTRKEATIIYALQKNGSSEVNWTTYKSPFKVGAGDIVHYMAKETVEQTSGEATYKVSETMVNKPKDDGVICAEVITYAQDPKTGAIQSYPDSCSVPPGYKVVGNQDGSVTKSLKSTMVTTPAPQGIISKAFKSVFGK